MIDINKGYRVSIYSHQYLSFMRVLILSVLAISVCSSKCRLTTFTDKDIIPSCTNKTCFIKVYAPWCAHCQQLAKNWEKFADQYCNDSIIIGELDGDKFGNEMFRFNLSGFPSMILLHDGKYYNYDGQRAGPSWAIFLQDYFNHESYPISPPVTFLRKARIILGQALTMMIELLDNYVLSRVHLENIPRVLKAGIILFILLLPTIFLLAVLLIMRKKGEPVVDQKNEVKAKEENPKGENPKEEKRKEGNDKQKIE